MPHLDWDWGIGYAIDGVLSQLISGIRPDKIVTKTNLGQQYLVTVFWRKLF